MRDAILRTLESLQSACLDNDAEREAVADALLVELRRQPDAMRVRAFFANAPTDGTRLIAMSASNGRVQSEIIEAAARLAGCP